MYFSIGNFSFLLMYVFKMDLDVFLSLTGVTVKDHFFVVRSVMWCEKSREGKEESGLIDVEVM